VLRATGSEMLALGALVVCLFKVSLVVLTQDLASDSLFSTACLGLLAAALLLSERVSPARIVLFLLFGFAVSMIRSIGAAILWPLLLSLALRFWPRQRRALGTIVVGSIGIYGLTATLGFINYGIWAPQAKSGVELICGAIFIADENVPSSMSYPSNFAAATTQPRNEYEKASSWAEKYQVIEQYHCSRAWQIAIPALIEPDSKFYHLDCFSRQIVRNEIFKEAALAAIRHNTFDYLKIEVVKLAAGSQLLSSYGNYSLQAVYKREDADERIAQVEDYINEYSQARHNDCDRTDLVPLMARYADDWRTMPRDLKSDVARPLRDLFDLVRGSTINWLFIGESAIVVISAVATTLRRRRIGDLPLVLLLLVLPVWGYLLAICLVTNPILRYLDATSPFVYIALLVGGWGLIAAAVKRIRQAVVGWTQARERA
jgi:hypothetical protein